MAKFKQLLSIRETCIADRRDRFRQLDEEEVKDCINSLFQTFDEKDAQWTAKQWKMRNSKKRSHFNVYLRRMFGGKAFVSGIFQLGLSWLSDLAGVAEHGDTIAEPVTVQEAIARFFEDVDEHC